MPLPELRIIQTDNHLISYRESGEGDVLFFVHGMGCGSINWETQYDRFSNRYHVIGWDAPGYGKSSCFTMDLPSVGDYVMTMAEFLNALGIKKVHLIGHSYGGIMVTAFYRNYSQRVLSLTLAQPVIGGGIQSLTERNKDIQARITLVEKLGMKKYAALHVPRSCAPNATVDILDKGIALTSDIPQEGYLRQFRSLKHANIFEWTCKPNIPAMIVSGEHDNIAAKHVINAITENMVGIRHETIANIGHMIFLEHPNRFNDLLKKFLGSIT